MSELPAGAEAVGGLLVGIVGALAAAGAYLRTKTTTAKEEREDQRAAHQAKLDQERAEHEARIAVLEAERARAAAGADVDLEAMVRRTVTELLPAAVADLQEKERLRVAVERQREAALVETIMQKLEELNRPDRGSS